MSETLSEPIIVEGYSPRYRQAVENLLGIEGGLSDDPVDRGGTTKYGISLRFLAAEGAFDEDGDGVADFDLDMDGDIDGQDVRRLTRGDAVYLYERCFWRPIGAATLPVPIGEALFDQAVNAGRSGACKLLQRAINQCLMEAAKLKLNAVPATLTVDGDLAAKSRLALAWVVAHPALGKERLLSAFRDAVRERYRTIVRRYPSQQRFLRGWLARAEGLGRMEGAGA